MNTTKISNLIASYEAQLLTLAAANTPRFKEKAEKAEATISILKEAAAEIHRAHREAASLRDHIDHLNLLLGNEGRNHDATKEQNRQLIHRLKAAGVPHSSYSY